MHRALYRASVLAGTDATLDYIDLRYPVVYDRIEKATAPPVPRRYHHDHRDHRDHHDARHDPTARHGSPRRSHHEHAEDETTPPGFPTPPEIQEDPNTPEDRVVDMYDKKLFTQLDKLEADDSDEAKQYKSNFEAQLNALRARYKELKEFKGQAQSWLE